MHTQESSFVLIFMHLFAASLCTFCAQSRGRIEVAWIATFNKLKSGSWRVQLRRTGRYASKTFRLKSDGEAWALESERTLLNGQSLKAPKIGRKTTLARLIQLHIADMSEVGKSPQRSKAKCLDKLEMTIGRVALVDLTRERLIEFGKARAREGAGPMTLSMDIGYIRTVLVHAAAIHSMSVPTEQVTLARVTPHRLGLVGKGMERDRRLTQDELDRIIAFYDGNQRQTIPIGRLVKFAVATAMRQEEICTLLWSDVDLIAQLAVIRNRKDPRRKNGNDQRIPLIDATGYDPIALLNEQRTAVPNCDRVFPYNGRSLGTAFRRACRELGIIDLHFHDLRHEATSRLFEAGFDIPEVSLVTGHKDWKMLRRYLNLRPHQLVGRTPRPRTYSPQS